MEEVLSVLSDTIFTPKEVVLVLPLYKNLSLKVKVLGYLTGREFNPSLRSLFDSQKRDRQRQSEFTAKVGGIRMNNGRGVLKISFPVYGSYDVGLGFSNKHIG